jgi:hypothetical protein
MLTLKQALTSKTNITLVGISLVEIVHVVVTDPNLKLPENVHTGLVIAGLALGVIFRTQNGSSAPPQDPPKS